MDYSSEGFVVMVMYVAVPKAKRGELTALKNTSAELLGSVVLVWDVPPAPKEKKPKPLALLGESIAISSSGAACVAVDLTERGGLNAESWDALCSETAQHGVNLIPVANDEADYEFLQKQKIRESVLRFRRPRLRDVAGLINRWADVFDRDAPYRHLLLDLRSIDEENADYLEELAFTFCNEAVQHPWQSIQVVAGAFPETLGKVESKTREVIERLDWQLTKKIAGAFCDSEQPVHVGDYLISHPNFGGGGIGTPSIRYTADDSWVIYMGDRSDKGDMNQFHHLAAQLVNDEVYKGPEFSWGDSSIQAVGTRESRSGNLTTWRAIATNHHLRIADDSLASLRVA